jgi:hypothetical protein
MPKYNAGADYLSSIFGPLEGRIRVAIGPGRVSDSGMRVQLLKFRAMHARDIECQGDQWPFARFFLMSAA